jgi:predicted dehydrogenase
VRLALCGLGSAALRAHAPAIHELVRDGSVDVVAVCDRSLERRALGSSMFGAPGFAEVHRMLHELEPDILVVATPPSRHVEAVRAGLHHHAHVVCEKPLGLRRHDVEELDRLRESNRDLGLVTVHQYEYAQPWQSFSRLLRAAIARGEPWSLRVEIERPGTDPLSAGGWRARPAVEGGILGDHAVHYVSMLWKAVPGLTLGRVERTGAGTSEHAQITLTGSGGTATIAASYAGNRRRNRIVLRRPERDVELVWMDGAVTVRHHGREATRVGVTALSDRDAVNSLYRPLYRELVTGLPDRVWRTARWQESVGVARLLSEALGELVQAPRRDRSYVVEDMRRIGRKVRHVLADRGINRRTEREVAIAEALSLDPHEPAELATLLMHCVDAGMLTEAEAADLRADPAGVQRLLLSLEGRPVSESEPLAVGAG